MCLAVPAQVVEKTADDGIVDLQGNRLQISLALTPDAQVGDWVLVHAGFAITQLEESEARETWDYLSQVLDQEPPEALAGGQPAPPAEPGRPEPPPRRAQT